MKLTRLLNLVALAILTLGLSGLSHAQAAGPTGGQLKQAPQRRQPVIEALSKVNLTLEEKAKIQTLVKTRNENMKTYRDAHKGDTAAIKTYVEAQQKQFLDGIRGVLTPAQWDQFQTELKKIMEEIRAARKNSAGAAGANPPVQP